MCPIPSSKQAKLDNPELPVVEEDFEVESESSYDSGSDDEYVIYSCPTEVEFLRSRNTDLSLENQLLLGDKELLKTKQRVIEFRLEVFALKYKKLELKFKALDSQINFIMAQLTNMRTSGEMTLF